MKTINFILLLALSSLTQANNIIFKSGFENSAMIGGTVTGLNQFESNHNGLLLTMKVGPSLYSNILLKKNGDFRFPLLIDVGTDYEIFIVHFPSSPQMQVCTISNTIGVQLSQGVFNIGIDCSNQDWNWDEYNWNQGGWQ